MVGDRVSGSVAMNFLFTKLTAARPSLTKFLRHKLNMSCSKTLLVALALLSITSAAAEAGVKEFICDGSVSSGGTTRSETAYLSLELYGSWMFWANDDGKGRFEIPGGYSTFLGGVDEIDGKFFLYKFGVGRGVPDGIFSKLSSHFEFRIGEKFYFEGNCREMS